MAENVVIKHGNYLVEDWRMKDIKTQEINDHERERIIKNRHEWLHWMNRHFAYKTLLAPKKYL